MIWPGLLPQVDEMTNKIAERRRVVVTGISVISCIGNDTTTFWNNLRSGTSGIRKITSFDASHLPCKVAGEVQFDPREFMNAGAVRRTARVQQLLFCCVSKALERCGGFIQGARTGLVVGTGGGAEPFFALDLKQYNEKGWTALDRLNLLKTLPNMAAAYVAQHYHIEGPVLTLSTACASSTDAIARAGDMIRNGAIDTAIVAGTEAWITELSIAQFCLMQALSTRSPDEAGAASRPFDRDRDGMVPAEGAAVLLIEGLDSALQRGREPLAEVLGAGSSCDGHHLVQPHPEGAGAVRAMELALHDSGITSTEIDHINAHGTSTPLNDKIETLAVKRVFGSRAFDIPLTANKSIFGHASGAAGAMEAVASVMTLRHQFVPPTINLETPDPDCDLDYTAGHGRTAKIDTVLSNSFGFGGQNASVILRRFT